MRTAVANGDVEMVDMLVNAKADVDNRGSNVSACIHGVVRLLYMWFDLFSPLFRLFDMLVVV